MKWIVDHAFLITSLIVAISLLVGIELSKVESIVVFVLFTLLGISADYISNKSNKLK